MEPIGDFDFRIQYHKLMVVCQNSSNSIGPKLVVGKYVVLPKHEHSDIPVFCLSYTGTADVITQSFWQTITFLAH
jgi:hypothetical protein